MPKEASIRAEIRATLKDAGYRLVLFEPRLEGILPYRPDVLAFAANTDGDLIPWLVVEVKNGAKKQPASVLPQLLKAHELLGSVDHYGVIDGHWFRADRSLRSLEPVEGPAEPPNDEFGILADASLATLLLTDRLWFEADKARTTGGPVDNFISPPELFAETAVPGIETARGDFVPVRPDVLWQARRRALAAFTAGSRDAIEHTTDLVIADAVARLVGRRVGGTVLDPFCGIGNFLWATLDRALELEGLTDFVGQDINQTVAQLAGVVARTAPLPAAVTTGDSLKTDLPEADVVVAAPPFGSRLAEPWKLLSGQTSRDFVIAAIDRCLRLLRPKGRAVFLLPVGVTFQLSAEHYRRFLATEFRVGALIGLPPGALAFTNIRTVLLVVDRGAPGETFVAQLGEDWKTQLSSSGAAMTAILEHLDAPGDGD